MKDGFLFNWKYFQYTESVRGLGGGDPLVGFDSSEWLEGAPVADGPNADNFEAWLEGAPVVGR